jgi:hypothetical protein
MAVTFAVNTKGVGTVCPKKESGAPPLPPPNPQAGSIEDIQRIQADIDSAVEDAALALSKLKEALGERNTYAFIEKIGSVFLSTDPYEEKRVEITDVYLSMTDTGKPYKIVKGLVLKKDGTTGRQRYTRREYLSTGRDVFCNLNGDPKY